MFLYVANIYHQHNILNIFTYKNTHREETFFDMVIK